MNTPTAEFAAIQTKSPQQIVAEWRNVVAILETAKAQEMQLRRLVLQGAFAFKGDSDDRKGTTYFDMADGERLKAVFKQNYKVNADTIDAVLSKIEKTGPEGKFLAERLVKFKPELSASEYSKLPDDSKIKKMIDEALTISAGTPSLEFVVSKK